jgi:urease accessory protein
MGTRLDRVGGCVSGRHEAPVARSDGDASLAAAFLGSLQLADSFFPGGGYTLSHGLESYAEAGLLDVSTLTAVTSDLIRHSVGPSDAVALAVTVRAAQAGDLDLVAEADQRLTAVKLAHEPRQASIRLGRQILAIARDTFGDELSGTYLARVRAEDLPGNQAVAMGLLKSALGVPVWEAVAGELYTFATTCAGAALRMSLIDHRQAQQVLRKVAPAIISATEDALDRTVAEIGGSAPFAEIMTMRHETAEIRLFVT